MASLGWLRMAPEKTSIDSVFIVTMFMWLLVEVANNESDYPRLFTYTRRTGIFIAAAYLVWISTYYIE